MFPLKHAADVPPQHCCCSGTKFGRQLCPPAVLYCTSSFVLDLLHEAGDCLQEAGGCLYACVANAELGVDPDRLPRALKRPCQITRPFLVKCNIEVDSRALPVVAAERAAIGRDGSAEHIDGLGELALIGIDAPYVMQTRCRSMPRIPCCG